MVMNRCFKNTSEAQIILDQWVEYGLGIYVDEEKKLFVPLGSQE